MGFTNAVMLFNLNDVCSSVLKKCVTLFNKIDSSNNPKCTFLITYVLQTQYFEVQSTYGYVINRSSNQTCNSKYVLAYNILR